MLTVSILDEFHEQTGDFIYLCIIKVGKLLLLNYVYVCLSYIQT